MVKFCLQIVSLWQVPNTQNEIGPNVNYSFTNQFSGSTNFNNKPVIYASSALLTSWDTSVEFSNNVGTEGGAIFLAGDLRMLVYDNTAFQFTNNTAS